MSTQAEALESKRKRARGVRLALQGAEAVDTHSSETIGYVILEEGCGNLSDIFYEATQSSDTIRGFGNAPPYSVTLSQAYDETPLICLASKLEMDGGNGGWVIHHSITTTTSGLMIEEDQVRDSERSHTTETCGFLIFETSGSIQLTE